MCRQGAFSLISWVKCVNVNAKPRSNQQVRCMQRPLPRRAVLFQGTTDWQGGVRTVNMIHTFTVIILY